jgi:hypothetical protein
VVGNREHGRYSREVAVEATGVGEIQFEGEGARIP